MNSKSQRDPIVAAPFHGRPAVNGLPLPDLLVSLMNSGLWKHPGDTRLREVIPFQLEPVDFLTSVEAMARESSWHLADDPKLASIFHETCESLAGQAVELPWRDVDRSFIVAINRFPGDDVAIALDYRATASDPRVIANDWGAGGGCVWVEVAPMFSQFVAQLGLYNPVNNMNAAHDSQPSRDKELSDEIPGRD